MGKYYAETGEIFNLEEDSRAYRVAIRPIEDPSTVGPDSDQLRERFNELAGILHGAHVSVRLQKGIVLGSFSGIATNIDETGGGHTQQEEVYVLAFRH
jgi:hypothetical protein